jgi:leucyl-tRNA synthetase
MELLNAIAARSPIGRCRAASRCAQEALELAVMSLSPIVPHVCHELWQQLGHGRR